MITNFQSPNLLHFESCQVLFSGFEYNYPSYVYGFKGLGV